MALTPLTLRAAAQVRVFMETPEFWFVLVWGGGGRMCDNEPLISSGFQNIRSVQGCELSIHDKHIICMFDGLL